MTSIVRVHSWRGEAALTLVTADYAATFLPDCGMLGVSLTHDGAELLALPRSIEDYRRGMPTGGYTGLPLNAPYANRLARRRFRIDGRDVSIPRRAAADGNGLPIHGTLEAQPFAVESIATRRNDVRVVVAMRYAEPRLLAAFPFVHSYRIEVALSARGLAVTTIVATDEPTGVPVSFGWHPFLRVPNTARSRWELGLPSRRHARLDERLLPTGVDELEAAESRPLGSRTFDDHYALGRDRRFSIVGRDRRIDVRFDEGYGFAQIYVPPRDMPGWATTDFVCIEPMTAPINALLDGVAPLATRANPFAATFTIAATHT